MLAEHDSGYMAKINYSLLCCRLLGHVDIKNTDTPKHFSKYTHARSHTNIHAQLFITYMCTQIHAHTHVHSKWIHATIKPAHLF
jgi:hypothetical protein